MITIINRSCYANDANGWKEKFLKKENPQKQFSGILSSPSFFLLKTSVMSPGCFLPSDNANAREQRQRSRLISFFHLNVHSLGSHVRLNRSSGISIFKMSPLVLPTEGKAPMEHEAMEMKHLASELFTPSREG